MSTCCFFLSLVDFTFVKIFQTQTLLVSILLYEIMSIKYLLCYLDNRNIPQFWDRILKNDHCTHMVRKPRLTCSSLRYNPANQERNY